MTAKADPFAGIKGMDPPADDQAGTTGAWFIHGPQGSARPRWPPRSGDRQDAVHRPDGEHGTQRSSALPGRTSTSVVPSVTALTTYSGCSPGKHDHTGVVVDRSRRSRR